MSLFHAAAFDGAAFDNEPITVSVPVVVDVSALEALSLPVIVSVVAPGVDTGASTVTDAGTAAAVWTLKITIDGDDVTTRIIGPVTVDAEESAARIAEMTLSMPPGTVVLVTDWIGADVSIWLAKGGTVPSDAVMVFTGVVDTPTLKPGSGVIGLRCTDNRQGVISAMSRQEVETMISDGVPSPVVFDAGASSLVYAGDLLSTCASALDIKPGGGLRVTPWAAKVSADLTLDDDDILDNSVEFDPADRAGMVNRVTINFGYRFPRQRCEGYQIGYDRLALDNTSFGYWVKDGGYILFRSAVESAIERAGASIIDITWLEIPTHAVKIPGTDGYWLPTPQNHNLLCMGFGAVVTFDFNQDQQENFVLTVENPESIARLGVIGEQMNEALEGRWDDPTAAEHAVLLWKKKISSIPPRSTALLSVGYISATDAELTDETNRDAAKVAMETLISIARTRIAAAHRRHRVSAAVAANPVIDLDKTISIDAQGVTAKGKVRKLAHRFDPHSGSAVTEFTLAVSSIAGVGITHPDSAVVAPDGTAEGAGTAVGAVDINWNGLLGQDNVITISFPGVDGLERNNRITEIGERYDAPIAEDVLEITL